MHLQGFVTLPYFLPRAFVKEQSTRNSLYIAMTFNIEFCRIAGITYRSHCRPERDYITDSQSIGSYAARKIEISNPLFAYSQRQQGINSLDVSHHLNACSAEERNFGKSCTIGKLFTAPLRSFLFALHALHISTA